MCDRGALRGGRLLRRCAAVLCLLLLLTLGALRILAEFRLDALSHRGGGVRHSPPTPSEPWAWSYEAVTTSLVNAPGMLVVTKAVYVSLAETKEGLDDWASWGGWQRLSAPTSAWPAGHGTYFRRWNDFCFLGLRASTANRQGAATAMLEVPHWMVALVLAGATVALIRPDVRARRLRRRRARGLCERCRYDREGLSAAAPCPECNAPGPGSDAEPPASQP